jgi:hypothetical protein
MLSPDRGVVPPGGQAAAKPPTLVTRLLDPEVRLPVICGALAALALIVVIPMRIAQTGYYNHVSGAWAALADDLAHGVLYRPLLSDYGYGGTRYFPMHFLLHGMFAALGLSLRAAGHLVALLSGCLIVFGSGIGLGKRGENRVAVWSLAFLPLASRTAFMAVAGIRGDILPVALGVMGLALAPRSEDERDIPSAIFLSLALLAKPTLVWAPAAAVLARLIASGLRPALKLGILVTVFTVGGLVLVGWASHGELIRSFKACASGGGVSLKIWLENMHGIRPGDLAWIFGGAGLTLLRGRKGLADPMCTAGLVCIPVTLVLYASKGIHVNHFIDSSATGALGVGAAFLDKSFRASLSRKVLIVCTFLGVAEGIVLDGMLVKAGELQATVAAIPPGRDPVLSEQPWIPLLMGERAFCLDAFSLLITRKTIPAISADLMDRLDHCRFRAVALLGRPELPSTADWYDETQFGAGFRQHLLGSYQLKGVYGAMAVYVPRCGGPAISPQQVHDPDAETMRDRNGKPSRLHFILERLKHK